MSRPLPRPATAGVPLSDLAARVGASGGAGPVRVSGVTLDSRAVRAGDLYAALPGFHVHGARFAADAVRLGAVAVLTDPAGEALLREEPGTAVDVPVLTVERPREVLGSLAAHVYGNAAAALTMVGITGTNGKTTTAYLIDSALRALGRRTGLIGTVETRIGAERIESVRTTPEATDLHAILAVMKQRGVDACVMEVSSHALDLHRVDGVVYDVALFTNLSQDHLDFHPSMEDYFRAKAQLFTPERCRAAVVCVDDPWGARLAQEVAAAGDVALTTLATTPAPPPVVTPVRPTTGPAGRHWSVEPGDDRAFTLRETGGSRSLRLVSHLPGTFNVANTALAALALLATGMDARSAEAALAAPPVVPGRMEVVAPGGPGQPRCIVDFAHTPDAVDAALAALRPSTTGRLIAVLGAGGDRDRAKRPAMGAAAARHADVVVVTDDNPRSEDPQQIRGAVLSGARALVESGAATATVVLDGGPRAAAIAEAVALAVLTDAEGRGNGDPPRVDTVVVLGKGHEKGQEISGVTHPFDDRDAVRAALEAAGGIGARA